MNIRAIAALAALAVVAIACEYQVTGYPLQGPLTRDTLTTVMPVSEFHWVKDIDEVIKACPSLKGGTYLGCTKPAPGRCDFYMQKPADFNDAARLAVIGHEVLHCLGAEHAPRGSPS